MEKAFFSVAFFSLSTTLCVCTRLRLYAVDLTGPDFHYQHLTYQLYTPANRGKRGIATLHSPILHAYTHTCTRTIRIGRYIRNNIDMLSVRNRPKPKIEEIHNVYIGFLLYGAIDCRDVPTSTHTRSYAHQHWLAESQQRQ